MTRLTLLLLLALAAALLGSAAALSAEDRDGDDRDGTPTTEKVLHKVVRKTHTPTTEENTEDGGDLKLKEEALKEQQDNNDAPLTQDGEPDHAPPGTAEAEETQPAHGDMAVRWPPLPPSTLPAAPPTAEEIASGKKRYVCLTFDDGPNGRTSPVAEVVSRHGKADFYFNCHRTQQSLFARISHVLGYGHGVQSHQCDHATIYEPYKGGEGAKYESLAWPSATKYTKLYGDRKKGECFVNGAETKELFVKNYGQTVRRYADLFKANGKVLPADQMTLARLPGDGRFFKCLTGALEAQSLAGYGHTRTVTPAPHHSGWQFECATNHIKWGHLPHVDHMGVKQIRCSEKGLPRDGDIILMHEAHFNGPVTQAALGSWLAMLVDNNYEIGRISPATGKCVRWEADQLQATDHGELAKADVGGGNGQGVVQQGVKDVGGNGQGVMQPGVATV